MTDATIVTLTGQAYRAAFAVAPLKDVRYYINGIHIDTERGQVVATDGSIMYMNDVELGDDPGASLIFEPARIQASVETVRIYRHDDHNVMLSVSGPRTGTTTHICKLIDGRYPDYQAIIPKTGGQHRLGMGFDVKHLATLKQIFKKRAGFSFSPAPGACKITGADSEGTVVLMEMRA